jgi:DNA repair protein RecO (recombination protein O)
MSYIKASGIVIREVNTGEADKIITILSKSLGKISAFAKNARRPRSRMVAGTQLLCYSNFVLFKGRDMYSVNTCDVVEPFYEIRNDVVKLTYSAYITDMVNDIIQEEQPAAKSLQLVLNTLYMISKTDKSPELMTRIFEMRFLTILGYSPVVRGCSNCGAEEFDQLYFSFKKCGFLCKECLNNDTYAERISPGAARALRHIVYSGIKELFNFKVSESVLNELGRISRRYIKDRLDREYRKLDFLKTLEM